MPTLQGLVRHLGVSGVTAQSWCETAVAKLHLHVAVQLVDDSIFSDERNSVPPI